MAAASKSGRDARKNRRRAGRALRFWGRLGLALLAAGLLAGVAYPFVAPYRLGQQLSSKVRDARSELADLERENRQLQREVEYLASPEGIAERARREGYRKKGEIVYRVRAAGLDAAGETP